MKQGFFNFSISFIMKKIIFFLVLTAHALGLLAQANLFTPLAPPAPFATDERVIQAQKFTYLMADTSRLLALLWAAPPESEVKLSDSELVIELIDPDGVPVSFQIVSY
ncbi:MAG: hypothetical protein D6772_03505 [Bacteroidetes bacterium]|nr:MAG: hypothetical protein D6772_03505 [Bacteroidota bacterium]